MDGHWHEQSPVWVNGLKFISLGDGQYNGDDGLYIDWKSQPQLQPPINAPVVGWNNALIRTWPASGHGICWFCRVYMVGWVSVV